MPALVVPGVRVDTIFDVLPPLPAPSGIVGVVGVVDRPPAVGKLTGVSKVSELGELLGPGSLYSLKEGVHALHNGASEAVISAVAGGTPASHDLLNKESNPAARLRCRFNRNWGSGGLAVNIKSLLNAAGVAARVTVELIVDRVVVETHADLRVSPGSVDDLFSVINSRSRLVVATDPNFDGDRPEAGTNLFAEPAVPMAVLEAGTANTMLEILPADGANVDEFSVIIAHGTGSTFSITIFNGGALLEEYTGLTTNPDSDNYLPYVLQTQSELIRVRAVSSLPTGEQLPVATNGPIAFTSQGTSPSVADYQSAIDLMAEDKRIDLVIAAIEPKRADGEVHQIHQALTAHAVNLADDGAPRIAFGSITPNEADNLELVKDHSSAARNRRFVLVTPAGAEGAVAGMVGRMNPQDSPTFKPAPLHGISPSSYRESQLNRLLGKTTNALVVQDRPGRGVIVLRGLDTTGDQISVTRVADQAIRETKAISENFIGQLNSEDARIALKQQLIATFTRMERAGAIVPSTDRSDPAFVVDVYSTQTDFAQGIVRIDIAVRPVRAIDYIYATIRVKN
ncbi:MAG: hypothetical protein COA42_11700 [Alteromonadaceae bacterium]|nr:MAG: hypothetical protein COA42_11700 [Alteromonadaceae bacterium]